MILNGFLSVRSFTLNNLAAKLGWVNNNINQLAERPNQNFGSLGPQNLCIVHQPPFPTTGL